MNYLNIESVLKSFPTIKLPYEIHIDKKVSEINICVAIPAGNKCLAWFTNYQGNNVCFIIQLNTNGNYESIYIAKTSFSDKLAFGTILYGTEFMYNHSKCFCIEDIFQFQGKNTQHLNYDEKLTYMFNLFENHLNQTGLCTDFVIFGLPVMNSNFSNFIYETTASAYKIDYVQFRYFNSAKILRMTYNKPGYHYFNNRKEEDERRKRNQLIQNNKMKHNKNFGPRPGPGHGLGQRSNELFKIFTIKAEIDYDIYTLYENEIKKGIALIPDFKTSVYLNSLFRSIKENNNLDSLEESDDEEEFENCNNNKFVDLDKALSIKCKWNSTFKKWFPCVP